MAGRADCPDADCPDIDSDIDADIDADIECRMHCMACGWAAQAIADGAKAGASMTSSRSLAVQREAPHICGTAYQKISSQLSVLV
jgi:hypothetical protein